MNHLTPCPSCNRHVRTSESACPFCSAALSLADVPAPVLPRARLGRAATFAFGATLIGAASLVGCGPDNGEGEEGGGGNAGASSGGSSSAGQPSAGSAGAGTTAGNGGGTVGPVYGAPA